MNYVWRMFHINIFFPAANQIKNATCTTCPMGQKEYFKHPIAVWEEFFMVELFLTSVVVIAATAADS